MARAAGIPDMSNAHNPAEMYRRMRNQEFFCHLVNLGPELIAAAAAADHNLDFYTMQVQLAEQGPRLTVVKMDVLQHI
jgi:hypothetical protein